MHGNQKKDRERQKKNRLKGTCKRDRKRQSEGVISEPISMTQNDETSLGRRGLHRRSVI